MSQKYSKEISLSSEEGKALVTLLKRIYDFDEFEIPLLSSFVTIAAELKDTTRKPNKLLFVVWNNWPSGYKFDLEIAYAHKKICMLHTNAPHKNSDGTLIDAPHLHLYKEGTTNFDAIPFGEFLKDKDKIDQCIFDFLSYCSVENINDLPLQLELEF